VGRLRKKEQVIKKRYVSLKIEIKTHGAPYMAALYGGDRGRPYMAKMFVVKHKERKNDNNWVCGDAGDGSGEARKFYKRAGKRPNGL
jgi:hypothetical protein